jgi:Arc/MetJ family transcription regulator
MSRTNIEIDYSKPSAVDLALRRPVGEPLDRHDALALQGSSFDFTNDEVEGF